MISEIRTAQGTRSMESLPTHPPDPEVSEKAVRRRFTAEYKLDIVRQADHCRTRAYWKPFAQRGSLLLPSEQPGVGKGGQVFCPV